MGFWTKVPTAKAGHSSGIKIWEWDKLRQTTKQSSSKLFWETGRELRKRKKVPAHTLCSSDGVLLTWNEAIIKCWKEYFEAFFNPTDTIYRKEAATGWKGNDLPTTVDEFPKVVKNSLLARFLGQIKFAPSSSTLWCGYKGWQVSATMCRSWEQYPWIGKLGWRSFFSRKVTEKGMYDITRITLFTLPGKGYARVWLSLGLRSKKSPGLRTLD